MEMRPGGTGNYMDSKKLRQYSGKRILVTGHTGFKGVWLTEMLLNFGAEVSGLALEAESDSLYTRMEERGLFAEYFIDIRDRNSIMQLFEQKDFDGVFHLAAQPLVRKSYSIPVETFAINVIGTINILDAILSCNSSPWVVVVTSDKVYKNYESLAGFIEDSPLGGTDPYSASKAACEIAVSAYRNLASLKPNGPKIVSARSGNVIGGGDSAADRLMPDVIKSFHSGKQVEIRQPNSIRPWQHVLDPLNGYLHLGQKLVGQDVYESAYNFGPSLGSKLTVLEIVQIACKNWTDSTGYLINNDSRLPETELLWLDSSRALRDLGWSNKLDATEAIKWTLDWEHSIQSAPVSNVVANQIREFYKLNR